MILRNYQTRAVANSVTALKKHDNTLLVGATGCGKTVMISATTKKIIGAKKRALIVQHRDELTDQNADTFDQMFPDTHISFFNAQRKSWRGQVIFSMIQTLSKSQHLDRMPPIDLLIYDECFPPGTLIDGKPIEKIQVGDYVLAYNGKEFKQKQVIRIFKRQAKNDLIKLSAGDKSITCTPNHPVLTKAGWKAAQNIEIGDFLYVNKRQFCSMCGMLKNDKNFNKRKIGLLQKTWTYLLLSRMWKNICKTFQVGSYGKNKQKICSRQNEKKQSNVQQKIKNKNEENFEENRTQTSCKRWQWNGANDSTKTTCSKNTIAKNRTCHWNWKRRFCEMLTNTLQDRFSNAGNKTRNRDRRQFSLFNRSSNTRQEKRTIFEWKRVDSVEVQKSRNKKQSGKLCSTNYVYNLEVADWHTYVANGIVVHNCHHSASNSYRKLTARAKKLNPKTKILGVTATPERADSKGLKDTFSNVADIITIGEMVQGGYLVPPRGLVIDIGTQGALRAVKKTASDYNMAEVEAIQNSIVLNKRIIEKWEEEAVSRPTVAFCATIKHALDVRDSFRDAGYISESISSNTPKKERKAILKSYDHGEIQVLANPMLLTEGWDCQVCSCVMLLRISSHKSTMIQMIGRGLRKVDPRRYPGIIKTDCKILDFGISLLNHSNLEADVNLRFDRQSDGKTAKKNCPMCNSELPIQAHICPLCGYEFKILAVDEDFDELEEFKLIEIDILNNSPFKWISIFPSEKVLVTTGFGSWAAVVSMDGQNWFAIGNGQGKKTEVLTIANKIGAISSADDYMRANETSASSKKAAKWMNDPASMKQQQILFRMGYQDNGFSKVEAAAHLTFRFNQGKIEGLIA